MDLLRFINVSIIAIFCSIFYWIDPQCIQASINEAISNYDVTKSVDKPFR